MGIFIKNKEQILKMRSACKIVAGALRLIESNIRTGVTTGELDSLAGEYFRSHGAKSSSVMEGFPANVCISVNEQVIHGVPGIRKLKSGDIVSVDISAYKDGFHGDAARTFAVGNILPEHERLINVAYNSFYDGVAFARNRHFLHEISAAIGANIEKNGFSAVREYLGHGIGAKLHEEPQIPNTAQKTRGPRLAPGMTLAVEPMVNMGTHEIRTLDDGWTMVTRDRKYSAHYENTVLVTDGEPDVLTLY